jgi:AcrR family transcriptional regulator
VARKGFSAVTIADLAATARVSKRSFHEQFRDKSDCFIALYEGSCLRSLAVLQQAFDAKRDWHDQVEQVLAAYFGALAANPALLSTLFIDIMAIGPAGLAARRRTTERMARFIIDASGGELGNDQAVAIIGGLHEWVLQAGQPARRAAPAVQG